MDASKRTNSKERSKVMATIFWDSTGIIFIDYFEVCKTINSEYYSLFLGRQEQNTRIISCISTTMRLFTPAPV